MEYRTKIRLRMSAKDAHYGGNLVDGAHMVHLFGDVATELLIMRDGDEGLFCAYDMIEFKAPVYAGADELDEPILVCRASGTCVTPKDCQRK